MPWLHAFVEGGAESGIAASFELFGAIPKMILVDSDGVIVAEGYGACVMGLDEALAKHLGGER